MRMRKKAWARPELDACPYYIKDPSLLKGKWSSWYPIPQPLHVELGCGKGVFTSRIASLNPGINYLGIDLSCDVLGVARRNIEQAYAEQKLPVSNIALAAYDIERILDILDGNDTAERIYINFCNPWPKGKHHKKRLTHTRQLEKYKTFLADGGEIWFKTDNTDLYLATLRYLKESGFEVLSQTADLSAEGDPNNIVTEHELMFTQQGIPIKRIAARWNKPSP